MCTPESCQPDGHCTKPPQGPSLPDSSDQFDAPTFSGTLENILAQLKGRVSEYPRRVIGQIDLEDRKFYYADLHSFFHQAHQIFVQKLYHFQPKSPAPLIVDGGAHIGLASLYFARCFPNGTIHSFEADPAIARLLARNVKSFALKNVHVHPQALWTHSNGVAFHISGDDSGKIQDQATSQVASVRLRHFIAQQPRTVDLLKLDVEGAEYALVKDSHDILDRVEHLVVELHQLDARPARMGELLGVLERAGFRYTFGDFHPATWVETPLHSPFSGCPSAHFVLTLFAWKPKADASDLRATVSWEELFSQEMPPTDEDSFQQRWAANPERVLARCDKELEAAPTRYPLYYARALSLHRLNRTEEARGNLSFLLQHEPAYLKAKELLRRLEFDAKPLVHIASYPRSGNTWLRLLLTDLILQNHGIVTNTRLQIPPEHVIPDLHLSPLDTVDHRLHLPVRFAKTHACADTFGHHAIFLFRQPADALVSFYHYHIRDPLLSWQTQDGMDEFCLRKLPDWIRHAESFLHIKNHPKRQLLFVSYEQLHEAPIRTLQRVGSFVGLIFPENNCRAALDHHRFDKLKQNENQNGPSRQDFYRRGKVNSALTELKPDTLKEVASRTSDLLRQLHYLIREPCLKGRSIIP